MTRRSCAAADLVGRAESLCSVYLVSEATRRGLRGYRTQHTLRTEVGASATCAAVSGTSQMCGVATLPGSESGPVRTEHDGLARLKSTGRIRPTPSSWP